ncbi:hypothetical protein CJF42_03455 [Pseudoalteromonas sp. NBT06-2]|nr:hypothetical protein CJF42_03455 [Pseudoalteromonas sp. NBT06-2]
MVPSAFVLIEAWPLTTNGKVDKKRLPEPEMSLLQDEITAPENDVEQSLAEIWSKLLNIDINTISTNANFFDLGGSSLLLANMHFQIQKLWNKQLEFKSIITKTSIKEISLLLDGSQKEFSDVYSELINNGTIVMLNKGLEMTSPIFMLPPLGGYAASYGDFIESFNESIPVVGLQAVNCHFTTMPEVMRYYLNVIKQLQLSGKFFIAGWSLGGVLAYEIAVELHNLGETVSTLLVDSGWVFDDNYQLNEQEILNNIALEEGLFELDSLANIEGLSFDAQQQYLLDIGKQRGTLPDSFTLEDLKFRFEIINRHYQVLASYEPSGSDIAATFIEASESQTGKRHSDGWRVVMPNIKVIKVKGTHQSIMQKNRVDETSTYIEGAYNEHIKELQGG